jgi:hypothetical protein
MSVVLRYARVRRTSLAALSSSVMILRMPASYRLLRKATPKS